MELTPTIFNSEAVPLFKPVLRSVLSGFGCILRHHPDWAKRTPFNLDCSCQAMLSASSSALIRFTTVDVITLPDHPQQIQCDQLFRPLPDQMAGPVSRCCEVHTMLTNISMPISKALYVPSQRQTQVIELLHVKATLDDHAHVVVRRYRFREAAGFRHLICMKI